MASTYRTEYHPSSRDNAYLRPLEPRRSQAPSSSSRGRVSTGTWVSSSQFHSRNRPPPEPVEVPSPAPGARSLGDHPQEDQEYDDGHWDQGNDTYHESRAVPVTGVEHMTMQVEQRESYLDAESRTPQPKRGSFVGGFFRRMTGSERHESQPLPPDFAPGIERAPAIYARNVTYVDTTEMPDEDDYLPPRRVDHDGDRSDGDRGLGEPEFSEPPTPRGGSRVAEDHELHESPEGTVIGDHHTIDVDGTTAVHHNTAFIAPTGDFPSPVYREPPPTSDYDKMSAFHTAPSELYSLSSYIDRVQMFVRDLYDLPWTSSRVAADYIPGESSRSKYYRFKQRHPNNSGIALNSWYRQPTHHDLDLLASPAAMRESNQPFASMGPLMYPGSHSGHLPSRMDRYMYTDSPAHQTDEVRSQLSDLPPPPRPFANPPSITWDARSQGHDRPNSPPRSVTSGRTHNPQRSNNSGKSFSYSRDRNAPPIPTITRTMDDGPPSTVYSPRTDVTIHTDSHTATTTTLRGDRERGTIGGTAGSEARSSPRTRQSWYSNDRHSNDRHSNDSTPTTRMQPLHPSSPERTRSDGGRSYRSAGRSNGRGPTDGTMPVHLEPVPASPPRTAAPPRSSRRNRYDHYTQPFVMNS